MSDGFEKISKQGSNQPACKREDDDLGYQVPLITVIYLFLFMNTVNARVVTRVDNTIYITQYMNKALAEIK